MGSSKLFPDLYNYNRYNQVLDEIMSMTKNTFPIMERFKTWGHPAQNGAECHYDEGSHMDPLLWQFY